jgi:RND family efflux transporter MFP subunit
MRRWLLLPLLGLAAGAGAAEPAALIPWNFRAGTDTGVRTLVVQPGRALGDGLLLQGTAVLPAQQSDLVSMPLAGVVQAVLVAPMQAVRAGQPVARVMSPELAQWQREWLLAETQARLAKSKAERDEQLFADGIVSEHRRNESKAQYEMAAVTAREHRQALRLAGVSEATLERAAAGSPEALSPQLTLVAPVAGTVLEQLAAPGQRLEAGSPVARLARGGRLVIELQASAQQAQLLRVGDTLTVDGCQTPARLTALSPQLSSTTQGVQLRAELTKREDCLRINQFVQVRWQGQTGRGAAAAFSVPVAAVVQQGGKQYVFVRQAQGFVPTVVTVGPGSGSEVLVSSGLKAGDEVAVQGVAAIKGAWLGLGSGE